MICAIDAALDPCVGENFVLASPAMNDVLDILRIVARSNCNPVLILGETGTGKEVAARTLHALRHGDDISNRHREGPEHSSNTCPVKRPFVAVNCAALNSNLLESDLFGHTRGAFTGADREKVGLFEAAAGGSILLDEISELPLDLQARLLRVLQERTFRKVGGTQEFACKATVIACSNRDLNQEVKDRKFRGDLYHRLAVLPIRIPPLRAPNRRDEIPTLARHFLKTSDVRPEHGIVDFTPEAVARLASHTWPGNVRELKNVVDRAILLETSRWVTARSILLEDGQMPCDATGGDCVGRPVSQALSGECESWRTHSNLGVEIAPQVPQRAGQAHAGTTAAADADGYVPTAVAATPAPFIASDFSLAAAERLFIHRALEQTHWQKSQAAALLGITRTTLYAKLRQHGIEAPAETVERIERPRLCPS